MDGLQRLTNDILSPAGLVMVLSILFMLAVMIYLPFHNRRLNLRRREAVEAALKQDRHCSKCGSLLQFGEVGAGGIAMLFKAKSGPTRRIGALRCTKCGRIELVA